MGDAATTVAVRGPLSRSAVSPKNSPGPSIRWPASASPLAEPSRMTKKSPPVSPFLQRVRPEAKSTSSAWDEMNWSSLSVQPPKSGTERNRSIRGSATAGSLAGLGDAPASGVDLGHEGRAHAIRELALVVGVQYHDVSATAVKQRSDPPAAAERMRRVDRRRDDRFVRGEAAERDPERYGHGHAFEGRCAGIVVGRQRHRDPRGDEAARLGRRVADEER